jgi:YebC/PmpR family DNA-binding regulatory protein
MAGHSKWKNIRIRKGKQDAIRAKVFTKLSREIIVAAKEGGGDPATNARLRVAIQKARDNSVPAENVKRSIQRGTGEIEGVQYEEIIYEGYGPAGAAVLVECYTENRNRTVADLRHVFNKNGGNLSESGSVSWQFKHLGQITINMGGRNEEELTMQALDAGADDVSVEDEQMYVYTSKENLHVAYESIKQGGVECQEVELIWKPSNTVTLSDSDSQKLIKLLDALDDLDDVNETYTNVDMPEELAEV